MRNPKDFLRIGRQDPKKEPPHLRKQHTQEFTKPLSEGEASDQGARCMDCGVAFCHQGCPLGNIIPEFNALVSHNDWKEALETLLATNNFPEFTGRVCPAPCETACVLGINEDPVSIEAIEMAIADKGFSEGWIRPEPPKTETGRHVAVVGSGPAGLAAAQQLRRAGHSVTVFERDDRAGGLLMYGIPDFKLEKSRVSGRVELLEQEGVRFRTGVEIGKDVTLEELREDFDAVLLACGATKPRDLPVEGRELNGIHFAWDFLTGFTRGNLGDETIPQSQDVSVKDQDVIVIGGGDTGSDCIGVSNRQGARSITQFEILDRPPDLGPFPKANERPEETPWPEWTHMLRTSTSHEEGAERHWTLATKKFVGDENGNLTGLVTEQIEWLKDGQGRERPVPVPGSQKTWPCQRVFLAIGYSGPEADWTNEGTVNEGGTFATPEDGYMTPTEGVFAAGDGRRGQSLVVWAIAEGRQAAAEIHEWLKEKAGRKPAVSE